MTGSTSKTVNRGFWCGVTDRRGGVPAKDFSGEL